MSQLPEKSAAGWPEQAREPGWQQQPAPTGWAAQVEPPVVIQGEVAETLPTEFDHLFRDSTPDSRKAIDRQRPGVGGQAQSPAYYAPGHPDAAAHPEAVAGPPQQQVQHVPDNGGYQHAPMPYEPAVEHQPPGYQAGQYQQPYGYQPEEYQTGQYQQQPYAQQYQPGGYAPGDGGWGAPPQNSKRLPLFIGGGVAAVAVIGLVIAMSSGGGGSSPTARGSATASATPTANAQTQAAAIYAVIDQSGPLRSDANSAVSDVNACRNLPAAQSLLQSTAAKRQSQADQVAKLDVSKVPNGTALVQALQQAWSASANADTAYANIATDLQTNCKAGAVKKDANFQAANDAGRSATSAKSQAAQLWNDAAQTLGQAAISEGKL